MIGASAASLFPTTTTAKSVARKTVPIAAERNVSLEGICAAEAGGHGNKALSLPMREESPAARIKPAKLGARVMIPFRNQQSKLIRVRRAPRAAHRLPQVARIAHETSSYEASPYPRDAESRLAPP